MKVLLVNGSPHERGCTYTALRDAADAIDKRGIETEIPWLRKGEIPGCMGSGAFSKLGKRVRNDIGNVQEDEPCQHDPVLGSPPLSPPAPPPHQRP